MIIYILVDRRREIQLVFRSRMKSCSSDAQCCMYSYSLGVMKVFLSLEWKIDQSLFLLFPLLQITRHLNTFCVCM
jgi:hypothetical protein